MGLPTAWAEAAYQHYEGLGPTRSLVKVHRFLTENTPEGWDRVPSLRTLKAWSSQFSWGDRVWSFDREVVQRVQEQIIENEVEERVDLLACTNTLLVKVGQIIDTLNTSEILANTRTAQDLRGVAASYSEAVKIHQLLTGEPTERIETVEDVEREIKDLERQIAEAEGTNVVQLR